MAIDHTHCTHPRTPAGRRACRAGRAGTSEPIVRDELVAETPEVARPRNFRELRDAHAAGRAKDEIKMTGATARKLARHAAKADAKRIQPRRSGARVAIDSSGCVQAALHVDAHGGRCACGWRAKKIA